MGNVVIELSESGPMDGKEVAVPKAESEYRAYEYDGKVRYQNIYRDSGRRSGTSGYRIFERTQHERIDA